MRPGCARHPPRGRRTCRWESRRRGGSSRACRPCWPPSPAGWRTRPCRRRPGGVGAGTAGEWPFSGCVQEAADGPHSLRPPGTAASTEPHGARSASRRPRCIPPETCRPAPGTGGRPGGQRRRRLGAPGSAHRRPARAWYSAMCLSSAMMALPSCRPYLSSISLGTTGARRATGARVRASKRRAARPGARSAPPFTC